VHNSHPCEFARNGFIQEINKWNPQGTIYKLQGKEFARNGISKEEAAVFEFKLC